MRFMTKLSLVAYFSAWSTLVAWLSVRLMFLMHPELKWGSLLPLFSDLAPVLAAPIALRVAFSIVHNRKYLGTKELLVYIFLVPLVLYLCLAVLYSLMFLIWFPVALVTGLWLGLPALVLGTAIHAFGILPLWVFRRHIFATPSQ